MERAVQVVGTLSAHDEATVAAQVAGQLEKSLVDLGDRVTTGQEMVLIDVTAYEALVRYGKLVGPENLMAGSDCGFATFASYLTVHPAITWAKLHAMAEGAALASKQLY